MNKRSPTNKIKSILLFFLSAVLSLFLISCGGTSGNMAAKGILPDSTPTGFPDTAKLKSDLNNIIQGMNSKKPDTVKIKQSASDILSTTATMLSDSGISNIGGNSQDPSVKQAKEMFKKMRDSMGITTKALDDMKKSAQKLSPSTP